MDVLAGLLLIGLPLAYAAAMAVLAPRLLTRGVWRFDRPGLCLGLWQVALHTGLAGAATSFVAAMWLAAVLVARSTAERAGWVSVQAVVLLWVVLAVAGVVGVVVTTQYRRLARDERRARRGLSTLEAEHGIHRAVADGTSITVVESPRAVACALPGRARAVGCRHRVLVSSGLARSLDAGELRAVVLHEQAHLRLHHPLLLRLARLNAACVPLLPGPRELERVSGMLVELIADDAAARHCGDLTVAGALTTIGSLEGDAAMLLRAERLRARRRPRVRRGPARPVVVASAPGA
ncbi:hypothetical protein DT076_16175 [Desertihabitans brevis]|uniref:M56 family peptidase n=1 Tax=Desertihabitans brevis TaxID=2268447 RepID=A0A367YRJ8_9ACTN|nr:M48 family metalloprotease [Desertihabitans brevis]RCK68448.1 hypothetical protein DT076_16175 [Desertihabitans brevis]